MISQRGWLQIDGGRVQCPRRGEAVDIARCLECNWLLELDRAGRPTLRCATQSPVPDGRDPRLSDRHAD